MPRPSDSALARLAAGHCPLDPRICPTAGALPILPLDRLAFVTLFTLDRAKLNA